MDEKKCPECGRELEEGRSTCECGFRLAEGVDESNLGTDPLDDEEVYDDELDEIDDEEDDFDKIPLGPSEEVSFEAETAANTPRDKPQKKRAGCGLFACVFITVGFLAVAFGASLIRAISY